MLIRKLPKISQATVLMALITGLFFLGSAYLFQIDDRYENPRFNQAWFSLEFSEPKSDSLDFAIENFTDQSDFRWELWLEEKKLSEGIEKIPPRSRKMIPIENDHVESGRYLVRVFNFNETQEIYKNIYLSQEK